MIMGSCLSLFFFFFIFFSLTLLLDLGGSLLAAREAAPICPPLLFTISSFKTKKGLQQGCVETPPEHFRGAQVTFNCSPFLSYFF